MMQFNGFLPIKMLSLVTLATKSNHMPVAFIRIHSGKGLFSSLIQFQSWSKASHVSLHVGNRGYEAREGKGVREFNPYEENFEDIIQVRRIYLTNDQALDMRSFLRTQLGKGYDYIQVFRFLLREKESHLTQDKWFCSELVAKACSYVGVNLFGPDLPPWKTKPCDFLNLSETLAENYTERYLQNIRCPNDRIVQRNSPVVSYC